MDREFPRSIHHCINGADECLHAITGTPRGSFRYASERWMGQLRAELDFTSVDQIIRDGLHEYLDRMEMKMNAIGDSLQTTFVAEQSGVNRTQRNRNRKRPRRRQSLMGIRVALHHKTVYEYDRLVTLSPQMVRLRPAPHSRTPVTSYSLSIEPEDTSSTGSRTRKAISWRAWCSRIRPAHFSLEVDLVAEMTVINPFDFFLEPYAENYPFRYESWERRELAPFLEASARRAAPGKAFLASIDREKRAPSIFWSASISACSTRSAT